MQRGEASYPLAIPSGSRGACLPLSLPMRMHTLRSFLVHIQSLLQEVLQPIFVA